MRIVEKVIKRLKRNNPQKVAEKITKLYEEKKENGEEHPIDDTVEELIEIIKENNKPEKRKEILKEVVKQEKLPKRVSEKTFARISKTDEIPDRVITQVIEDVNTKMPDESINTIIDEGDIEIKERLKIIQKFEDKTILEERIINEFKILYKLCKNKRDNEVVDRIEELKDIITKSKLDMNIKELIKQIVAKKMAENFYSDISKGTKIYTLAKVMSVEEMIESDLPSVVEEEFKKIEENHGKKEERFDKSKLKIRILREMARDIAYKYKESEIFAIPQSDNMKELKEDEEDIFIKTIESASGKKLLEDEILDIKAQIKGRVSSTQTKEMQLISEIKKMPNKNKSIDFLSKILSDKQTLKTFAMLEESGLINQLNLMSEEKRKKSIKSIGEVLEKRKNKIAISSIKVKNNLKIDTCKINREGR